MITYPVGDAVICVPCVYTITPAGGNVGAARDAEDCVPYGGKSTRSRAPRRLLSQTPRAEG
jgi:hypothetical protein